MVPYLGFLSDSVRILFHLIAEKKGKFLNVIRETLSYRVVSVKPRQRLAGKCVSCFLWWSLGRCVSHEKWIAQSLKECVPINPVAFIRLFRRKLPTGCSWKIGMIRYRRGMNAIFAYPLQLIPPAQAGVESCYHHPQQVSQITGRRRNKAMISTQEKQSL